MSPGARNRLVSGTLAGAAVLLLQLLFDAPARRAFATYATVVALGYGHLVGAVQLTAPEAKQRNSPSQRKGRLALPAVVGVAAAAMGVAGAVDARLDSWPLPSMEAAGW